MKVALDTNVLAYAEGVNGLAMRDAAADLVSRLPVGAIVLPAQALAELFHVLIRKAGRSRADAGSVILDWSNTFAMAQTSVETLLAATELAVAHQVGMWDAIVLCAAANADCRLLLSEDMQDGFTWMGVTVTNPFASSQHPLLTALMASG